MKRGAILAGAAVVALLLVADFVDDGAETLTTAAMSGAILLICWLSGSDVGWLVARAEVRRGRPFWFTGLLQRFGHSWFASRPLH